MPPPGTGMAGVCVVLQWWVEEGNPPPPPPPPSVRRREEEWVGGWACVPRMHWLFTTRASPKSHSLREQSSLRRMLAGCIGRWVGGWVGDRKVEEVVGMRCCGWVGGKWVGR